MIRAVQLTHRYGPVVALEDIGFEVAEGECVGLVGPSGAGKSTLLRILNGFLRPTSGCVEIGDLELGRLNRAGLRRLRADVGIVYQQFHLVRRSSALTNALSGAVSRTGTLATWAGRVNRDERRRALEALDRVGLLERWDQRAETLSGGQQQRLAIARTLVHGARYLLADEPVASLDPGSSERLMQLLVNIAKEDGRTILVSLHQVDLAIRHCDRIIGLQHGKVVLDTPTTSLTTGMTDALYSVPVDAVRLAHEVAV